jgi:chromosome segregation ATPase
MEHSAFDDIFSSTLTGEKTNYADDAMQYLHELYEMKDKFEECTESVEQLRKHVSLLYQAVDKFKAQISILRNHLHEKDREIASLRAQLQKQGFDWTPVDLGKIEIQVKVLEKQIKLDTEKFHRTGKYPNIEQSINSVRNIFDTVLNELNKANAENQNVESMLKTLLTLEVNYSKFFN